MKLEREDEALLERWLLKYLQQLNQPNPGPLSKYTISLLKQEHEQDNKLRQYCQEELRTFLKDNSSEFVTNLFSSLQGMLILCAARDYLTLVVFADGSYRVTQTREERRKDSHDVSHFQPLPLRFCLFGLVAGRRRREK
jgi:hypothetical protein